MKLTDTPRDFAEHSLLGVKDQIARAIRKAINDAGLVPEAVGTVVGCSRTVVGHIIRGEEWRVSFDLLYRIAGSLGINININLASVEH